MVDSIYSKKLPPHENPIPHASRINDFIMSSSISGKNTEAKSYSLDKRKQISLAFKHFEALLDEQQLDANGASEARFYVGESFQNMGEYRKAIEAYYKVSYHGAGGFSQWITSADFQRAKCHESIGEYATAIAVYERIVQREGGSTPQGEMAQEQIVFLRRRI